MVVKKIINDPKNAVEDFIGGILATYPNRFKKLQNHDVLLDANPSNTVQLISGGGCGHEPSHAGWIGKGMLSGAVLGGIFASPSVSAVLAAIRAAAASNKNRGVLLIVKNYTGDRLNFGMACEQAAQSNINCRMVVVADDCALQRQKGITGQRGVAGICLVHKVAGAAAEARKTLDEIVDIVSEVCSQIGTLGVSLDAVTVPGAKSLNARLDDVTIEIGLGIHGEAGMRQVPLMTANEIARDLLKSIQEYGRAVTRNGKEDIIPFIEQGDDICLLINNLGGTSNFELAIFTGAVVSELEKVYKVQVSRLFVGSYMTAFDTHGASITIFNLSNVSDQIKTFLDAPCSAPSWVECDPVTAHPRNSLEELPEVKQVNESLLKKPTLQIAGFDELSRSLVLKAVQRLSENETVLTKYDTIVGDGDCGITMKRGANEIEKRLSNGGIDITHPVSLFSNIADAISFAMGGTSGFLLELLFRRMSSFAAGQKKIDAADISSAFMAGVDALRIYGGATIGSRTMMDALIPAAKSLVENSDLKLAAANAKLGAEKTAKMKLASAGRSNYLNAETLEGTPDPGAVAVSLVFDAIS
ncbi:unnamed protein product [Cylindrotheca closterium]|uniref:Dihydroxyacetone kinase n=1 Tax=Cylindrotheca closterium TaxID=2856 RepID=A0AAD2CK86_9STRA|nr:unnamed protein product [Cylindrotheca closterium]